MRIYIAREIGVEIRGQLGVRSVSIGSGRMRPVPPTDLGAGHASAPPDDVYLDWEGDVRCSEKIHSGGFSIGGLHVRVGIAVDVP